MHTTADVRLSWNYLVIAQRLSRVDFPLSAHQAALTILLEPAL